MAEINKIKVSSLPEELDGKGFWIFGSKQVGSEHISRKFSFEELEKVVKKAAESVQLERRIAVVFEGDTEQLVPVAEEMRVERLAPRNIATMQYKENRDGEDWKDLKEGISFSGQYDIVLKVTSSQESVSHKEYLKYSSLTIFAKAKVK